MNDATNNQNYERVAGDVDPTNPGTEMWYDRSGLLNMKGEKVGDNPSSTQFLIWWDGDLSRELLNGNRVDKYRLSIAWQNVAYNQPPHTSFFFGTGMKKAPKPNIVMVEKVTK